MRQGELFDRDHASASATVLLFPLNRRRSKVADVARKLSTKRTEAHVDQYTGQVTNALRRHLRSLGLTEPQQQSEIASFWSEVDREVACLSWRASTGNNPRGAA
ncbi:DUF6074 family protein [Rhizobium sp. NTR19]|uniref:DUF6074 family protein n=1 Tax=Neorhizobium turbinariae TaxID=2937795 RepID=A0ABT0IMG2_9HYPH|nr:DUF6074 family protein [Neorhizobium turbinariae]MCK8779062.1 DUF6074 family protein [Neorhizobium turbinariae]